MEQTKIRNIAVIAHVDHDKTTLVEVTPKSIILRKILLDENAGKRERIKQAGLSARRRHSGFGASATEASNIHFQETQ